jgi:FkbM family methyltransferase
MPLRLIPSETNLRILQGPLRGRRWIAGSSTHGCWLGSYEYEKQKLFQRVVKTGDVVYDLGANVGFYSLLASTLCGPAGTVYAFEPLPTNLRYLEKHLVLNDVRNCRIFPMAVGGKNGHVHFHRHPDPSMGFLADQPGPNSIEVQETMLDDAIINYKLRAPNVIKCDIEGAEAEMLQGAEHTLREFRPTIFLATHGEAIHWTCCSLLRRIGYELRPLDSLCVDSARELLAVYRD